MLHGKEVFLGNFRMMPYDHNIPNRASLGSAQCTVVLHQELQLSIVGCHSKRNRCLRIVARKD